MDIREWTLGVAVAATDVQEGQSGQLVVVQSSLDEGLRTSDWHSTASA